MLPHRSSTFDNTAAEQKKVAVAERLETYGCDPIEGMTSIAMDKHAELGLRAQLYKELAQ